MKKLTDYELDIMMLIIFFLFIGALYFLIFGFSIISVLYAMIGIPILGFMIGSSLLIFFEIGGSLFNSKNVKVGDNNPQNVNKDNGIPENWDDEFKN